MPGMLKRPAIAWSEAFALFCKGFTYNQIALQVGCSERNVIYRAAKQAWRAKRERLVASGSALARENLDEYSVADTQLKLQENVLAYTPTELARVESRIVILEEQLSAERTAEKPDRYAITAMVRALDMLADRKRILLGIPLPGVVRRDSGRRQRAPSLPVIDVSTKPSS